MVWKDGYKGGDNKEIQLKAKITLVGLKCDVENIQYYVSVLIREIESKTKLFKQNVTSDRELVKSYRMGLVDGLHSFLKIASQTFNSQITDKSIIKVDERAANAKQFYLDKFSVRSVKTLVNKNKFYSMGKSDAEKIHASRPVSGDNAPMVFLIPY